MFNIMYSKVLLNKSNCESRRINYLLWINPLVWNRALSCRGRISVVQWLNIFNMCGKIVLSGRYNHRYIASCKGEGNLLPAGHVLLTCLWITSAKNVVTNKLQREMSCSWIHPMVVPGLGLTNERRRKVLCRGWVECSPYPCLTHCSCCCRCCMLDCVIPSLLRRPTLDPKRKVPLVGEILLVEATHYWWFLNSVKRGGRNWESIAWDAVRETVKAT